MRHFFPPWNAWLAALPDSRFQPLVIYRREFLLWWGLLLFCSKLGSRRQLDFQLRDLESCVLENVNRLAGTAQESLPMHKTLEHFLGHVGPDALAELRTRCLHHLMRQRVLDAARLQGRWVLALDGTGYLVFRQRHCPHCLTLETAAGTVYRHPVLEAKLVDPRGLALSIGTEFIENPLPAGAGPAVADYEAIKQDCELKAWERLAARLKAEFPRTALWISGDSLYACGRGLAICERHGWSYLFTFKPGRTPALWADFQGLLSLVPENKLVVTLPDGTRQCYRWVNDLAYRDSDGRAHRPHALWCEETRAGQTTTFAWLSERPLHAGNVIAIAENGGRIRSHIENEGFNIQKNSGLALEHAYSFDAVNWKSYYYLLQLAHLLLQLWERGSLLQQVARAAGGGVRAVFGSLKNLAHRLLDCLRYFRIPADAFDPAVAARCHVRLDGS